MVPHFKGLWNDKFWVISPKFSHVFWAITKILRCKCKWFFEIMANFRCTAVSFAVIVNDKNDNKPTFAESKINVSLEENISIGSRVTTVTANDLDSKDLYGKISYRLTGSGSDDFLIDGSTGIITVNKDIDYETRKSYNVSWFILQVLYFHSWTRSKKGWDPVWTSFFRWRRVEIWQKFYKEFLKRIDKIWVYCLVFSRVSLRYKSGTIHIFLNVHIFRTYIALFLTQIRTWINIPFHYRTFLDIFRFQKSCPFSSIQKWSFLTKTRFW